MFALPRHIREGIAGERRINRDEAPVFMVLGWVTGPGGRRRIAGHPAGGAGDAAQSAGSFPARNVAMAGAAAFGSANNAQAVLPQTFQR